MGDLLLTTPVLRNWKRCRPGDEVHMATKAAYADVLQHSPYLDGLHLLERTDAAKHIPAGQPQPAPLNVLIRTWRGMGFDAVLDLHRNWRTAQIRLALPRAQWSCVDKRNLDKWRFVRSKQPERAVPHIVRRYLDAAQPFGVEDDAHGLDANLDKSVREGVLAALPQGFAPGAYNALVLGAKQYTKRMPGPLLEALCTRLRTPLVLIGGPQEAPLGEGLEALAPQRILNRAGKVGMLASAALLSGARRVLAGDTGMMHWAAALGRPVCSVWGSTHPALGMYPYFGGPDPIRAYQLAGGAMARVPDLECRPCGKLGKAACPEDHFRCMLDLDPQDLADWLEQGQRRGMVLAPDRFLGE